MIFKKFAKVKVVVLDVDGVLTDGTVQVNHEGQQFRTFYVKDGYAIQLSEKMGIPIWVISGGYNQGVQLRLEGLGVKEIHLGVENKKELIYQLLEKYALDASDLLYMGDDMPDYEIMKVVGFATCPNDAVDDIKNIAQYMSPKNGGAGAVRDILEKILKLQGKWPILTQIKSI